MSVYRVYNFGAGPAMLPLPVLERAKSEWLNWKGRGISIVELNHRSQDFTDLLSSMTEKLKQLLAVPDEYRILFFSGPSRAHFSMVPLNLMGTRKTAHYLNTGLWSNAAILEAARYLPHVEVTSWLIVDGLKTIPEAKTWQIDPSSAYFYTAINETVDGFFLPFIPDLPDSVPLVTDATSYLFMEPMNISRFGLIFAGSQKNLAPAGLTLVIIREDWLSRQASPQTPSVFNYQIQAEQKSLYYTPCTFSCYMANLMLDWIQEKGGLTALGLINREKARLFYHYLDNSPFYHNPIYPIYRSIANGVFSLPDPRLEPDFINQAAAQGLVGLKGHRAVGGLRASFYNAMPMEGVRSLLKFMETFAYVHG